MASDHILNNLNNNGVESNKRFTDSSYTYDANGNLKSDSQKNITLGYNFLNLPQSVSGSQNLNYTYSAAGEKLKKQNGGTTTDYVDGIQYTNGSIDFIQTEEGIARNSSGSYSYEYNLSDHLGNVRATFYKNPNTGQLEVLQRDEYYAFGLHKLKLDNSNSNKYLYNGKELQEELGQYDYGARFYDPVIGRWNVVDALSDDGKQIDKSPYAYAWNNPSNLIDPDGNCPDHPCDGSCGMSMSKEIGHRF
ncbi:RHS repeat domain-containing protein [Pedobacter sp. W3I1]|uniref:RHS repeat domain-containing protein n=1 Tax=Pedobacter sp. W3I1 TaxID=3042291 RepID=UPI0027D77B0C|nr:RHS repeat-associated core domain-containing protein [Pedobacter sp. W3I1]